MIASGGAVAAAVAAGPASGVALSGGAAAEGAGDAAVADAEAAAEAPVEPVEPVVPEDDESHPDAMAAARRPPKSCPSTCPVREARKVVPSFARIRGYGGYGSSARRFLAAAA